MEIDANLPVNYAQKWQQTVVQGERPPTPSFDVRRQFESWFQQEMSGQQRNSFPADKNTAAGQTSVNTIISADGVELMSASREFVAAAAAAAANGGAPRVRMRTTFDPEQELPRLQKWFAENQHPTRFQVSNNNKIRNKFANYGTGAKFASQVAYKSANSWSLFQKLACIIVARALNAMRVATSDGNLANSRL